MKPRSLNQDSQSIVYDADLLQHPRAELFDPAYWQEQGGLAGEAVGRGSALFLETPFGDAVLRKFLRGGLPGRFIRDRYLFTGWERARPAAEFRVLAELAEAGLPVPVPIAALTQRHGLYYSGSLLTRRIMDALPVADLIITRSDTPGFWARAGACIRRFHDYGVDHADLNARNILVDGADRVYLIDFDRARLGENSTAAFEQNMNRLRRSFEKLWPEEVRGALDDCWNVLMTAYRGEDSK